jgi:hypothetical protein
MANVALRDTWDSRPGLIDILAKQLNAGSLSIFLGAGVSTYYGIPSWTGLLENLWSERGKPVPTSDLLRAAELYRRQFRPNDNAGFLVDVKHALYKTFKMDFDSLLGNPTLAAIGALVMSSRRGNVSRVVTFNYDDVLETYLEHHGFNTISLSDAKHWTTSVDVTLYHPHGFLPLQPGRTFSEDIVLDQKSYSHVIGDVNNLWHQQLFSLMRSHTLLLIGLSGTDPNLDSLLFKSKEAHASLNMPAASKPLFNAVRVTTDADPDTAGLFEDRGVFTANVVDYRVALPEFLFSICQRAAQLRSQ